MSELYQMKPLTTEDGGFYYPMSEKERYFYSRHPDTGRIFTNIVEWQADYENGYARASAEVFLDDKMVSRAEAVVFARSCMGKPHEGMFADTAATKAVGKALSQFGIGIDDSENRIPSGPVMYSVVPLKSESVPVPPEAESASPPAVPVQPSKVASPAATKAEKWSNRTNVIPASGEDAKQFKSAPSAEIPSAVPAASEPIAQKVTAPRVTAQPVELSSRSAKALASLWENYFQNNGVASADELLKQLQNVERMSEDECSQTTYPFGGDYKNAPLPTLMSSDGGKRCLCWATGIGEKAYKGKQTHIIRASRSIILKVLGL